MNPADLVTVYRSADMNAETDATSVWKKLTANDVEAQLCDDTTPGVVMGSWEVRVPTGQAAEAEELVATMNQDDPGEVDTSRELDMVTLAEVQGATGELEALAMQSILDANGIRAVVVGASTLPNLSFQVRVAKTDFERARGAIAEAQAAGPAAAIEAEQEGERLEANRDRGTL